MADPETETDWVSVARRRTVRALTAVIHQGDPVAVEADEPEIRFRLLCSTRLRRLWSEVVELARRMAGAQFGQGAAAEAIAAEGLSARPADGEPWPSAESVRARPADPNEGHEAFPPCLDWGAVADALPDDVDRLADDVDALDAFELDERMRAVVRAHQRIDWQMGRLLRTFLDRRLYLPMHARRF